MAITYAAIRISGTGATGVQVWEIGRFHSPTAALNQRNDQIEKDAAHLLNHSGTGGYVGIAPLWWDRWGIGVTLHAADGTVEKELEFVVRVV